MTPSLLCKLLGLTLLVIGVWGFVDGHEVLVFHTNTTRNGVYLASGVVALICGLTSSVAARAFCIVFGLGYGAMAIAGFMDVQGVVELLNLNEADTWLHAGLSAMLLLVGLAAWIPGAGSSMLE